LVLEKEGSMEDMRARVREYVHRAVSDGQGYLIGYYRMGGEGALRFMSGYVSAAMRVDGLSVPECAVVDALVRGGVRGRPSRGHRRLRRGGAARQPVRRRS
jgi:hypothetical protein